MTSSSDNLIGADWYHTGNNKSQENKVKYEVLNQAPDSHSFSKHLWSTLFQVLFLGVEHTAQNKPNGNTCCHMVYSAVEQTVSKINK